eukprot:TRINITY_DN9955_c0_g1_i15.p1 TRINITY_DN9955_c0_g1~~TRINITY_DN9955_c0_g1_i15.p1  ORF type:complete len:552 (-),score=100.83 TRINITY_DN9955_c0_g1_i15:50-1705(-)
MAERGSSAEMEIVGELSKWVLSPNELAAWASPDVGGSPRSSSPEDSDYTLLDSLQSTPTGEGTTHELDRYGLQHAMEELRLGDGAVASDNDTPSMEQEDIVGWRPRRIQCPYCKRQISANRIIQTKHHATDCPSSPAASQDGRRRKHRSISLDTQELPSAERADAQSWRRSNRMSHQTTRRVTWDAGTMIHNGSINETAPASPGLRPVRPHRLSQNEQALVRAISDPRKVEKRRTIGAGSFGTVQLCRVPGTSRPFAMKVLSKHRMLDSARRLGPAQLDKVCQRLLLERIALTEADHAFIVKLYHTFQNPNYVFMLMEYLPGGELYQHLKTRGTFTRETVRFYAAQIVSVLDHLHQQRMAYRDLKLENLVLSFNGYLRFVDFGFATYVEEGCKRYTVLGTPMYLAPEMIQNQGHSHEVDWWALGVVLFELLTGRPPFEETEGVTIAEHILADKVPLPTPFLVHSNKGGLHEAPENEEPALIRALLVADPAERLGHWGAAEAMEHRFLRGVDWEGLTAEQIPAPILPKLASEWDSSMFNSCLLYTSPSPRDS